MKKGLGLLVTIMIEAGIVYKSSKILKWSFVDLTFFAGICFVIITYYFSSKGGFSSNSVRLQAQARLVASTWRNPILKRNLPFSFYIILCNFICIPILA